MHKIVFISNFFNHHQKPLCDMLDKLTDNKFTFIATESIDEERKRLGYKEEFEESYIRDYRNDKQQCLKIIDDADVVILGSSPYEAIRQRIKAGKLIFKYSERVFKNSSEIKRYLPRLIKWNIQYPFWKPIYLLSASAYAPSDFKKLRLFRKKMYKWGYFPQAKVHKNIEELCDSKRKSEILWVGRFLHWKHPEYALKIAELLKKDGYDFKLNFIGTGEEESTLKKLAKEYDVQDRVKFLGSMDPQSVREHMENMGIMLVTSDIGEGWGAVVNEAMNSGCAVVASDAVGSVPYLMEYNENGLIYKSGDINELYEKVKYLLDNPDTQKELGVNAYRTMVNLWNAEVATERLLELSKALLSGEKQPDLYENGPCSLC